MCKWHTAIWEKEYRTSSGVEIDVAYIWIMAGTKYKLQREPVSIFLGSEDIRTTIIERIYSCKKNKVSNNILGLPLRLEVLEGKDWMRLIERIGKRLMMVEG